MVGHLEGHVLDLIEDADAAGEAQGVHVVQPEVQQAPGSAGDTVALAGDIIDYRRLTWLIDIPPINLVRRAEK